MRTIRLLAASAALAVVALAGIMWSADPAKASQPAVRVVPAPASAGSTVTVFGQGFCGRPSCAQVDIELADMVVASAKADANGAFTLQFTIRAAPGQYAVTASQANASGALSARTGLLVLPMDNRASPPPVPPTTGGVSRPPGGTSTPPSGATTKPPAITNGDTRPPSTTTSATDTPTASTAPTTSPPAIASGTTSGTPASPWPWIVGGIVVVAAAGGAVAYSRLRAGP